MIVSGFGAPSRNLYPRHELISRQIPVASSLIRAILRGRQTLVATPALYVGKLW